MSGAADITNPFPGPQPYRAADRARFFGREAIVKRLTTQLLARTATTLHGPSGAGKSSLMQAGVIPRLVEMHDFQVVRVDGWPAGEAPLRWLLRTIYSDLDLGEPPEDVERPEAIDDAMALAERRSEQPILIYLDQIEQLLFPGRAEAEAEALIAGVDRLARAPIRGLQIVLSLREDYLGRFRDRARERRELLVHGFRLGPLTVAEMASSVCRAAVEGNPTQIWDENQILGLMRDVRTPGQADTDGAEVQAAYGQIVCRALFQQNAGRRVKFDDAASGIVSLADAGAEEAAAQQWEKLGAEDILRLYLDTTLDALGELRTDAWRLLEDHLITIDGSRTLRTENELLRLFPQEKLGPILKTLEGAAILHAEAHQGSRYFEIGHDWLARRVHQQRNRREQAEAERRTREKEAEALDRERAEASARLTQARRQRRFLVFVAVASLSAAVGAAVLALWALRQQRWAEAAENSARLAEVDAKTKASEASDARLLAGFRELRNSGKVALGMKLLHEVAKPEEARGWVALANDALFSSSLYVTLRGSRKALAAATWSHDGKRIVAGSVDGTARIWSADGTGDAVTFAVHDKAIVSVSWSPDDERILTASEDGTARIWSVTGKEPPVVLDAHAGRLKNAVFSPDGKRVVILAEDAIVRVWNADGNGSVNLAGHTGPVWSVAFMPDGEHVLTASTDWTARLSRADGTGVPVVFRGHRDAVRFAAPSPDGAFVVTVSDDKTARVWAVSGKEEPVELKGHSESVVHAAWSPDGKRVATASLDKTGRIWSSDGKGEPVVLSGEGSSVASVAFRRDGRYVLTRSFEQSIGVWPVEGGNPLILPAHDAPIASAVWSPDGTRALTAAGQASAGRSRDVTAKVWRLDRLESLARRRRPFFHAASLLVGGERAVVSCDDKTAQFFRLDGEGAPRAFAGHDGWVTSASASPDGLSILTTSFDRTARISRVDGKGDPVVLRGAEAAVRAAAWSPDGARVVTGSDDKQMRIYRAEGGAPEITLPGHTDILTAAVWSPDGVFVATTSLDRTSLVWRADGTGEPLVLSGHGGGVEAAAWSPDGARIVTASEDGTAEVWNAKTGEALFPLEHDSPVLQAIWSPDGKRIATSAVKGGLWLWNADGSAEPVVLPANSPIVAMMFVDEGRRIVTLAEDNTTRMFTVDVGALRQGLETSNGDCLPVEMRSTYLSEVADEAHDRYAACERAAKRTPADAEGESP